ncbi:MAG: hypothetical protein RIQ70_1687 [Bacteroidota bacterium]
MEEILQLKTPNSRTGTFVTSLQYHFFSTHRKPSKAKYHIDLYHSIGGMLVKNGVFSLLPKKPLTHTIIPITSLLKRSTQSWYIAPEGCKPSEASNFLAVKPWREIPVMSKYFTP